MASGTQQISTFPEAAEGTGQPSAEYVEGESLVKMIQADLLTRRLSIESCRNIIQFLRDQDVQTRQRLENILAIKGQRVGDAKNRLARIAAIEK